MTPATRETLQVYATRMGKSWAETKREFTALDESNRGRILAEMRRVEALFQAELAKRGRRRQVLSVLFAPLRWLGRRLGGSYGSVLAWMRR